MKFRISVFYFQFQHLCDVAPHVCSFRIITTDMTNHNKLSTIKGFTRIKEFPAVKRNTNFGKRNKNRRDGFNCLVINLCKVSRGTDVSSPPSPVDVNILPFRESLALAFRLDAESVGTEVISLCL